jgi:hypothetical protein
MSCSCGRWCKRADALFGVEGIHISSVTATGTGLVLRRNRRERHWLPGLCGFNDTEAGLLKMT